MSSATGYTTVTATQIKNASGTLLQSGKLLVTPVVKTSLPGSFVDGSATPGQNTKQTLEFDIVSGAFTAQLADPTLAKPNIAYKFRVVDNDTADDCLGEGYDSVQWPTGTAFNFDTYQPNLADFIATQPGPTGLSAYQIYVQNGGELSQSAWLASLVGPPGASGIVGIPIYATAAAGVAAGSGAAVGGFFLVPSGTADNGYSVYKNSTGSAELMSSISGVVASSDGSVHTVRDRNDVEFALYSVVGGKIISNLYESRVAALESEIVGVPTSGGGYVGGFTNIDFLVPFIDLNGNITRPSTQSASTLANAIATINASCNAYGRSLQERFNLLGVGLNYDYNFVILDGQSMMSAYQAIGVYSTAAKHANKGLGQSALWVSSAGNATPVGDNNFDPLVEGSGHCESPTSGCANMLKDWLNSWEHTTESGKTLVFTNIACPGTTIDQHLPGAAADSSGSNLWTRVQNAFTYLKAAVPAGKTFGLVAVGWGQGEFNVGDTEAAYTAKLVTLRAAYDNLAATVLGQSNPATWFISQIGGVYISDAAPGVMHAQINYPLTTPNTYGIGSYYHIPNLGNGHRTGNGFRWLGTQWGRVMGQVLAARRPFEAIRPLKTQWVNNALIVGFHVPNGPLVARTVYNGATPTNYADLGFSLFDAQGYVPCTVSIVAENVVQLVPVRQVDQSTARLCYADAGGVSGSPVHAGMGNLADSNTLSCEDIYASPDQDTVAAGNTTAANGAPAGTNYDIPGLSGLAYPQNNFCMAFQINPTTFNGTF